MNICLFCSSAKRREEQRGTGTGARIGHWHRNQKKEYLAGLGFVKETSSPPCDVKKSG
jgi:hypothetical protein